MVIIIANCEGCLEELHMAFDYIKKGYHMATSIDDPMSYNINKRGHFGVIIVDDKGKLILY